ncbi:hypothetical protein BHE74_00025654 [Ensete ventricosum]|nr:hypothetical protein BHE74_00025654 [Ensete ventricosum]
MGSCLNHLLQETLGGNAKVAVICAISPDGRYTTLAAASLYFVPRLQEELMRAKLDEGKSVGTTDGHFKGRNGRRSLNLLRVSLNRSLILPHIDPESDEEMDGDEEDVSKLCIQLGNMNYSAENESESNDATTTADTDGPNADLAMVDSCAREVNINSSKEIRLVEMHSEVSERETASDHNAIPQEGDSKITSTTIQCKDSLRTSGLSIPCQQRPMLQGPILCSSPKLGKNLEKSWVSSESPRQSSKASPTDSLAVSLHRGLQIINYHERNSAARNSFVGLSFEHLTNISSHSKDKVDAGMQTVLDEGTASPLLCSACKNVVDFIGCKEASATSDMQIVPVDEASIIFFHVTENNAKFELLNFFFFPARDYIFVLVNQDVNGPLANTNKREKELEALCAEQAATIKHLSCLITENHLEGSTVKCSSKEIVDHPHRDDEREALLMEIQSLKNQLKSVKDVSENDCLLEQIRSGGTSCSAIGVEELEIEKQKWMESESRWISLTEELRLDLDKNRRFAEKKEIELNMEKTCTAELNDALQRSILGHARFIEHYVELQDKYDELLLKHRKIMEGIAQVKKAASKAGGGKGSGSAFAAALAAELSTLRIDREKERAYLKEQNRRLRIQLRDTAEAVHAAGELLVRLREAEEAASLAEVSISVSI